MIGLSEKGYLQNVPVSVSKFEIENESKATVSQIKVSQTIYFTIQLHVVALTRFIVKSQGEAEGRNIIYFVREQGWIMWFHADGIRQHIDKSPCYKT